MNVDDISNIGSRIKDRRKKKSLTIMELSQYTGLSTGYLSNIERNQTSPTLTALGVICNVLGVSVTDILQTESEDKVVIRKKEMDIKQYPELNQTIKVIDFGKDRELFEFTVVAPGKIEKVIEVKHFHDEMGTILRGSLVVVMEGKRYVLKKGDSIYIEAQTAHYLLNESDKVCESLWIYKRNNR